MAGIRWLRSWPAAIPAGRSYVVDDMERLVIHDYDYSPLAEIGEDVCIIEWDMALSSYDMRRFEWVANVDRSDILVAPYRLYRQDVKWPVWAHRVLLPLPLGARWLDNQERWCDYFGFGLIYLPWVRVDEFLRANPNTRGLPLEHAGGFSDTRFTDSTFSHWIAHNRPSETGTWTPYERRTRVTWEVEPVHLHG